MRRPLHRRPAVAAALLAALLTVSACSSDGDRPAAGPRASSGPAVPDRQIETEPTGPVGSPSALPKDQVLPDAKITPATGSFTQKQKAYLSGRVPKAMDPAAVLQTGEESCQRIARTAKRDKDAAIGAVIAGEIPDAKAAVEHLCPEQKPLLAKAETGFPAGTVQQPKPGRYRALTTDPSCTWRALGSNGKVLGSGPSTGADGPVKATIPSGTREFVSTSCYAWLPV
ncbi:MULTISPECIES: hypothetical protein [Streptomyces]|uniref:Lipoprotein n=1 Tax=Streptomyces solicathayae TaxID=3081768 RepID=A0ABZ0LMW5_9ACTN|nr:hypothetical protein [Streptomyces sp. HUAS YS2]WOX20832.1 hypothetical protein R2D22_05245 [Streptomyces sp. HUAS YS2]